MGLLVKVIIVFLMFTSSAYAACGSWSGSGTSGSPHTATAANGTRDEVAACITAITSSQGPYVKIIILTDTQTWTSGVVIDMTDESDPAPNFTSVTNLAIQGAGKTLTLITHSAAWTPIYQEALFFVTLKTGKFFDMSEMYLNGNGKSSQGVIYFYAPTFLNEQLFRVHGMKIEDNYRGIYVSGAYGLIDGNEFVGRGHDVDVHGNLASRALADADLLGLATAGQAVYIENNTFDASASQSGDCGWDAYEYSRYVFRYNTLQGCNSGHHGNESGFRGNHLSEIYNNKFIANSTANMTEGLRFRGGTGVVFNNVWENGTKNWTGTFFYLFDYRSAPAYEGTHTASAGATLTDSAQDFTVESYRGFPTSLYVVNQTTGAYCDVSAYDTTTATCTLSSGQWSTGDRYVMNYWNPATGSPSVACNGYSTYAVFPTAHDGNTEPLATWYGYPCQDQIGRSSESGTPAVQALLPLYIWNNTYGTTSNATATVNSEGRQALHIVQGRDYYDNTQMPGYSMYTCPHPLAGSGSCTSTAGTAGYLLGNVPSSFGGGTFSGGSFQ